MPLILPANTLSADAYDVANSCRFNTGDSPYMYKTVVSPTSATISTVSFWMKAIGVTDKGIFAARTDTNNRHSIYWEGAGNARLELWGKRSGSVTVEMHLTRAFRDSSAWVHHVIGIDTTQATAGNRVKWYVNGVQASIFTTETQVTEDSSLEWSVADSTIAVGAYAKTSGFGDYFDGYLAEVVFIDGIQYAASDFGEFDSDSPSTWKPKDPSGLTFGNNGFYLDFEASDNLGNDANGGTDLTESGLAAADQATDTPTNNFCTGNPIIHGGKLPTISEGNCLFVSGGDWMHIPSTIGVANGKWYAEFKCVAKTGGQMMGVVDAGSIAGWGASPPLYVGNDALGHCYQDNGNKQTGDTATSYGATYTDGDIIGAALNADDGEITFYKNNAVQASGTAITLPTSTSSDGIWFWLPSVETGTIAANWGGCSAFAISSAANDENGYGVFEYAPPSDYLAMCTKNLATNG